MILRNYFKEGWGENTVLKRLSPLYVTENLENRILVPLPPPVNCVILSKL